MHSRIFQISTKPIHRDDYIEESNYWDHWFIGSVADYVNGNTDRNDDIGWLKSCYEDKGLLFGIDNYGEYFIIEDKSKYFEGRLEMFKDILKELSEITLDDFITDNCDVKMYRLKAAYNDKFGFYVENEGWGTETLDDYIRHSDNGTKYYIGATIDYHF